MTEKTDEKQPIPHMEDHTKTQTNEHGARIAGDDVGKELINPFHLHPSEGIFPWMAAQNTSLCLSTYEAGKVVSLGPGFGQGIAVSERNFGHAMAMLPVENGFWLSTQFQTWLFKNGLDEGRHYDGWDRLFMPRRSHVTGAVDLHDLAIDKNNNLLGVITRYNCIGQLDEEGSFTPLWRPPFITEIIGEDRCHLNGFCLEDGEIAYATIIGESNKADGWRDHRANGGMVMDCRTNKPVATGLSMPHTPRLHKGKLWICEAGTGWFGWIDTKKKKFIRTTWCPGFLRGLRFVGNYAIIGLSKPRNKAFTGLPLDNTLTEKNIEPECGVTIIDLRDNKIKHKITITGSVGELYDVMPVPNARAPFLIGTQKSEISRFVHLGPDKTG